jgi:hypothetical protein
MNYSKSSSILMVLGNVPQYPGYPGYQLLEALEEENPQNQFYKTNRNEEI